MSDLTDRVIDWAYLGPEDPAHMKWLDDAFLPWKGYDRIVAKFKKSMGLVRSYAKQASLTSLGDVFKIFGALIATECGHRFIFPRETIACYGALDGFKLRHDLDIATQQRVYI